MKRTRTSNKQLEQTWDLYEAQLENKLGYSVSLFIPGAGLLRKIYNSKTGEDIISGSNGIIQSWIRNKIRERQ